MMKINAPVRVRFAPSPTGHLHIGGLRTALFNWLFARHYKGKFLLRIEDTDTERSRTEYLNALLEGLAWSGLISDEPLVVQSHRLTEHRAQAHDLVARGKAYICYCTPEELQARLGANAAEGTGYVQYDGKCRDAGYPDPGVYNIPYVIRFKCPRDRDYIVVDDLIRGRIEFHMDTIDDFIIVRSGGYPMYNFVVVIDDAYMNISHIIRGEEHLVNTPRQILLYEACDFKLPDFAHLPLILGADGTKLSKRDAATSVIDYQKNGFLPDALCNYLVRLGWSHGDQEIFTRDELIHYFSLEGIGKKGAIFDMKKLEWLNSVYIKQASAHHLWEYIVRDLDNIDPELLQKYNARLYQVIDLYKERVITLQQLYQETYNALTYWPHFVDETDRSVSEYLQYSEERLAHCDDFSRLMVEKCLKELCAEYKISLGILGKPLRRALVGKTDAPGIFDLLSTLGKDESIRRIHAYRELL